MTFGVVWKYPLLWAKHFSHSTQVVIIKRSQSMYFMGARACGRRNRSPAMIRTDLTSNPLY